MTTPGGDQIVVGSVAVEVTASARGFMRSLKREMSKAFKDIGRDLQKAINKDLGERKIRIQVEITKKNLADLRRSVNETLAKRPVKLPVKTDKTQAGSEGVKASEAAEKAAPPVNLKTDVDRKSLQRVLATIGKTLGGITVGAAGLAAVGALGQGLSALLAGGAAALGGLVPLVGQLASVLATAAGAAIAIPGALAIAGVAFAAFKIGVSGVGEALKAVGGDAAEFEEAIKNLAPAAQQFVRTIRDLKPAFDELRLNTQQALFEGLGDAVRELADTHLVTLRSRFDAIATSMNSGILDALGRLTTEQAKVDLRSIFTDAANAVANLSVAFGPLVDILRDVAAVGSRIVADLTGGVGDAVQHFANLIARMRESGELRQIILDGLDALKLLGTALLDVVGIFRGLFRAAGGAEGGGIFAFLDNLNRLINSIAGQETLTTLFAELGRIGTALMPVLLALGQGLGVVAAAIGDIAVGTAPFLADFLGLLAEALASLAPAFIALGPSVVALGQALLPLGQILADLVAGAAPGIEAFLLALADALTILAPIARPVGEALGSLLTALAPLLPVLGQALANSLTAAAIALTAFAEAFAPLIAELATGVLQALAPQLPQIAAASAEMAVAFADLARELEPLIPFFVELVAILAGNAATGMAAITFGVQSLTAVIVALKAPFEFVIGLFKDLGGIDLSGIASAIDGAFSAAWTTVSGFFADLFTTISQLPGQILGFLASLPGTVAGVFLDMMNRVLYAVGFGIGRVLRFFIELPGKIGSFIAGLPVQLGLLFATAMARARAAVSSGVSAVVRFFQELPGRARSVLSSLWSSISGAFSSAVSNARSAASRLVSGFIDQVRNLPGRARDQAVRVKDQIVGAFRGAASWLVQAGKDVLTGLAAGIRGAIGSAVDAAVDAARSVVDGFLDAFGVSSPSKVMRDEVGRWIPAGIAEGIRQNAGEPQRALDTLTSQFAARIDPFGSLPTGFAAAFPEPSAGQDQFTATAMVDLGEGIQRVVEIKFERRDRQLVRALGQGVGAAA